MIPVEPQPEPPDFDSKVRQRGLRALRELRAEEGLAPRPGRPRTRREATTTDELPPFWRECLDDLHTAYQGICAYVSMYIEKVTGARTVDHLVAKRSSGLEDAYEWSNYRLACARMNARKGAFADVLDPFEVGDGWFRMEPYEHQLLPSPDLDGALRSRVMQAIERLGLNDQDCCNLRQQYHEDYENGHISFAYLERRAPLVARELQRLGLVSHEGPLNKA